LLHVSEPDLCELRAVESGFMNRLGMEESGCSDEAWLKSVER
jgi:hypothetical protein